MLCVLAAGVTLIVVLSKIKREIDPEYLKLYVHTEEGKAILAGEFYKKKAPAEPEAAQEAGEIAEPKPLRKSTRLRNRRPGKLQSRTPRKRTARRKLMAALS
jgi:phosphatidylglycerol:prolipoprotein diacylglycerol transferase